ncbi:MAG: metallophosphoesterase [Dehalogenimonas sp.]|uniref:Metallophosphoesterase n=1 Tax=Candidatus Dehalogenimonas loeffleri TaxID=3127115 RepID=A0ABZ2J3R7_9CHLR|nr:metallophosphoesterase [Dehalogenimonas sp.]
MKPFSILHISDLHRSPHDPISNAELISALVKDRDRYVYEDPKIGVPEAIVVCGDIIQGVSLGSVDYETQLTQQYTVAEEFLDELVRRFLDGDRSRLIMIPGNHDIDWNKAHNCFETVDLNDIPSDLESVLYTDSSDYRLDWKSLKLLRITNRDLYEQRFDTFWSFFERFYSGVSGLLSVHPHSDANLFSLCDGRIGVAAFNSCHDNDCYAFHGRISKEAIARSHLELNDSGHIFDLRVAVWHHNIEGPPYRTDYMDVDIVRGMIGRGFRLGLYGHQHKAQITPHQILLPDQEKMAVVSAGSLCGGQGELPFGINRQYNILEISPDFCHVRIHVRSMSVANLFTRWYLPELGGATFVDCDWEPLKNPVGGTVNTENVRMRHVIEEAEIAAKSGNPAHTVELLRGHNMAEGSYARELLLAAAFEDKDWATLVQVVTEPHNILELVQLVEAFIQTQEFTHATEALDRFSEVVQLSEPQNMELRKRIHAEEIIKR